MVLWACKGVFTNELSTCQDHQRKAGVAQTHPNLSKLIARGFVFRTSVSIGRMQSAGGTITKFLAQVREDVRKDT